jgi:probable rRNA maturation factor
MRVSRYPMRCKAVYCKCSLGMVAAISLELRGNNFGIALTVSSKYGADGRDGRGPLQITMILFDPDQPEAADGFVKLAAALPTRQTLLKHLRASQAAVGLKGEVTVLLTTDDGIRGLNRRFRRKNKATDVLSFPAEPGFGLAGDLAISVDTAVRQADEQGHRLGIELRVLMLHGLLHLAGMDHETDAGAMAQREAKLRTKLKLPLGLIERVEQHSAVKQGKKQISFENDRKKSISKSSSRNAGATR